MKRRSFIKHTIAGAAAMALPCGRVFAAPEDYSGRFFVTLQASGAWDVASFCDPKMNIQGEAEINHWAQSGEIQSAGNIQYAPFANNAAFFNKYYQDMMVINGVDAQTNSHSTGVLHNWSGRNSAGYPSLSALFSSINAPELPLAYMNFGGYSETAKLIRYTRLNDINSLLGVLTPNVPTWNRSRTYRNTEILELVKQRQQERLNRLRTEENLTPRKKFTMDAYYQARENAQGLNDFADVIPSSDELEGRVQVNAEVQSNLRSQMQIALLAFKSGAACSADLNLSGFDTHANHDNLHSSLLAHFTDAIDYFWTYAEAQGLADRITLMIASDFSRTPYYNSSNGKDHWPIGSVIFMEKGASWGNRVIGGTDEGLNALKVDPATLNFDSGSNGTNIYPKHIHKAIRRYLGIEFNPLLDPFPFNNTEDLDIFS